jgi:putative ABC transport system permease protein
MVAIVTAAAAARLFAAASPVGRRITDSGGRLAEIVGVVSPTKNARGGLPAKPDLYYYDAQEPATFVDSPLSLQVPMLPPTVTAMLDMRIVSPGYFGVMGLERVTGQLFDARPRDACRIGVLNQQAADLYFGEHAVGGAVIDGRGRRITIVGVVRDERLRSTHRRPEPALYVPLEQEFAPKLQLLIASTDASAERQASVLRRLGSIDGGDPASLAVATLEERLSRIALASERIAALLLSVASVNALVLAVIGLYRITADDVLERQRELAVRSALGAQSRHLILLVIRRLGRTVLFGVLAGTFGAVFVLRWMGGVTGFDTASVSWIWLAGPLAIAIGSLLASLLPARRILKLDPLTAMRTE